MSKTLIGINTLTVLDQLVYANHVQFFYRLGRNNPDDHFALFTPRRMGIDRMRNEACRVALDNEFDYIMFIDDDVLIPFDAYKALKARDKDVVAAWTVIRGYPFKNMFFTFQEKDGHKGLFNYQDFEASEDGLIKVDAIGCSCVLVKTELLKKMPPPYFATGPSNTEDIYFCMKALQHYPEVGIYVDTKVKTGHLLGSSIATPDNVEYLRVFEEADNPDLLKVKATDRGIEYLNAMGETV